MYKLITSQIGDQLSVECRHDDYSMWFHVGLDTSPAPSSPERPVCTCGMHTTWSRSRIAMHSDTPRTQLYLNALTQVLTESVNHNSLGCRESNVHRPRHQKWVRRTHCSQYQALSAVLTEVAESTSKAVRHGIFLMVTKVKKAQENF